MGRAVFYRRLSLPFASALSAAGMGDSLADIAPTLAYTFGQTMGEADGRVMKELLKVNHEK